MKKFEVNHVNGIWNIQDEKHNEALCVFGSFVNTIGQLVRDNQSYDFLTNYQTVRDMIIKETGCRSFELTQNLLVVGILTIAIPAIITSQDVLDLVGIYDKYAQCRYQKFLTIDKIPINKISSLKIGIHNVLGKMNTTFLEYTQQFKNNGLKLVNFYNLWNKRELVVDLDNDDLTYKLEMGKYRIVTLRFYHKVKNETVEILAIDMLSYVTAGFITFIEKVDLDVSNVVPPQTEKMGCKTV